VASCFEKAGVGARDQLLAAVGRFSFGKTEGDAPVRANWVAS